MAESIKIGFIVTSCVDPCSKPLSYVNQRSVYSPVERWNQTQNTINSIHLRCPNAAIFLCDNGITKPADFDGVNKQFYVGKNIFFRKCADSANKSLGETSLLLYVCKKIERLDFDYIFKISGRYWLNESFDINTFIHDAFCFRNISKECSGQSSYIKGGHSTRLYSFPGKCIKEYKKSLLRSLPSMLKGNAIEWAWPQNIHYSLFYVKHLGLSGHVAVDEDWKDE